MADLCEKFDSITRLVKAQRPGINESVFKSLLLLSLLIQFGHDARTNRRHLTKFQKAHKDEADLVNNLLFEYSLLQQLQGG